MRKILILGAGLVIAGIAGWFLDALGANAQVIGVAVSGIPLMFSAVDEYIEDRGKTKQERVKELLYDDTYRNPVVVATYLVLGYQLLQRVIGMFVGAVVGTTLSASGATNSMTSVVFSVAPPFILFVSLPISVLLAKYAAHHIQSRAVLWISAGFIVSQLISQVVPILVYGRTFLSTLSIVGMVVDTVGICLLLVASAALGSWWARRTHRAYIMRRLFKRLSPSEQRDLIDLVQTLPGVPN
jgi:hypothetical protein